MTVSVIMIALALGGLINKSVALSPLLLLQVSSVTPARRVDGAAAAWAITLGGCLTFTVFPLSSSLLKHKFIAHQSTHVIGGYDFMHQ